MAKEGFTATISQYELQFRVWKVRKNMKRGEWDRIIQGTQRGGETTQITLSGRVISGPRIETARRRYKPRRPQTGGSVPHNDDIAQGITAPPIPTEGRHTSVERVASEAIIQPAGFDNGTIDTATHAEIDDFNFNDGVQLLELTNGTISTPSHESLSAFDFCVDITDPIHSVSFNLPAQERVDLALETGLPLNNGPFSVDLPPFDLSPGFITDVIETQRHQVPLSEMTDASFGTAAEWTMNPLSPTIAPSDLLHTAHRHKQILPRNQLMRPLPSVEITARVIKGIHSDALTTSARGPASGTVAFSLAGQFLADIYESVLKTRRSMANREHSPVTFPPVPKSLLSENLLVGEEQNPFALLPNSVELEARLYSRLIASVINGFAGLENMPAAGVLKFLNRHKATQLLMIEFLVSSSSPVAKSLAENIFQAALEADDVDIVKYLIDHSKLVDANETVCHDHGRRCTPLQKAAVNLSFGVLRLLISRKVDVNKSFSRHCQDDALCLLVSYRCRQPTLDDSFLGLVDVFVEAKAPITKSCIHSSLEFADPRLAIYFIERFASQKPQELISDCFLLKSIAEDLEKRYATSMIELIIKKCQESGGDWPLYRLSSHINHALYEAVGRRYEKLVGILFPYTSDPGSVFQAATKTGNPAIIDLILQMNPGLDGGSESSRSLSTALKSGEQDYLRSLEERGVLNHIQGRRELAQVFTTALDTGNLEYATKILDLDPDLGFVDDKHFDMAAALSAALTHGFEDIAWQLLAARAGTSLSIPLLHVTIEKRKPDFMKAIIESGVDHDVLWEVDHDERRTSILEAAIECGDDSILNDIWKTCPYESCHCFHGLLVLAFEKGRMGLFWDIIESHPDPTRDSYTTAVQLAIEYEDIPFLDELIARGARLDDDRILYYAAGNHFSMVEPLLERYQKAYPQGIAGYGQGSIREAIRRYPESSKLVDMFFAFGLINVHILEGDRESEALLTAAIRMKNSDECLIKRLLDAGIDVNSIIKDRISFRGPESVCRTTALLDAIEMESMEVVQLLIQYGAKVNEPTRFGIEQTPLQKAANLNNLQIVCFLLENSADANAPPARFQGGTALQFAAIHGNCEMATILIDHGAQLDVPPPLGRYGRWPLEGAAEHGRLDMIQFLWDANGGPFGNKQCKKALRLAEYQGHLGCRDLIVQLMAASTTGHERSSLG
ncbi:hypothetical protein F4677DRAFT_402343 [Hypoxylon crocopeplum]|nr:hypothetical protein F4677DRAFT_402343 [Hypoxylon crocopeplum]